VNRDSRALVVFDSVKYETETARREPGLDYRAKARARKALMQPIKCIACERDLDLDTDEGLEREYRILAESAGTLMFQRTCMCTAVTLVVIHSDDMGLRVATYPYPDKGVL
jgi:hypothetical protein